MTPIWRDAIVRAATGRRRLHVWLAPDWQGGHAGPTNEGGERRAFGRATLALSGWNADDGPFGQAVFIDRIAAAPGAESRLVDAALSATAYVSSLASAPSKSGNKQLGKRRFLRDILEHPLQHVSQVSVGVYDVGQGSASALVDEAEHPRVFFDVGKPISMFNYTKPANPPVFFQCDAMKTTPDGRWCHAPVVLSHWDFDHWAGVLQSAHVRKVDGMKVAKLTLVPHALDRYWIVPNQEHLNLGPTHKELIRLLAKSVNAGTGMTALQYWPRTLSKLRFTHGVVVKAVPDAGAGRSISAKRNNSGLVMLLTRSLDKQRKFPSETPPWLLLPGDARSESIPVDLDSLRLVGMVVSHHGGVLGDAPAASPWLGIKRLNPNIVCSVGRANAAGHGPYGHPTSAALAAHAFRSWHPVTFTYDLGNYCVSLDRLQPRCGCCCVQSGHLSLNRIPGT